MTRLPQDDRNVVDRPDLPEYELNTGCCVEGCNYLREEGGGHHIWRRSFGTRSWWVELSDGTVVGNRVGVCFKHHEMLTTNNARIVYEFGEFWWVYYGEGSPGHKLTWQPPNYERDVLGADYDHAVTYEDLAALVRPAAEGAPCPTCKRRIPHSKKTTTPKSQVWSTRVPVGDSSTFSEMVDAAAEHMGATSRPYHRYYTLTTGLALILQAPKEHLPNG